MVSSNQQYSLVTVMPLPYPSPFFLTVVLTILAMGGTSGVQAKPVGLNVPYLDITTSIKIGRPHFGERLGPFIAGQKLTLTCSTEAAESASLSWWEGDTKQRSSVQENKGIISSSFTIQTLRVEDNGRRFICRDEETLTTKTIELLILPVFVLDITSSIKMGQPILEDTIGPYTTGQQLTLTCSSKASGSVSLSWWEGDKEQESSVHEVEGFISSSFTIQTLRMEDNRRVFTCRDVKTQTEKSIEIRINTDALEIIRDGNPIKDGEVLKGIAGDDIILNCIMQGYHPSAVSWWEGEAELESAAYASPYAMTNVLSLKALTVDDNGRSFKCRSLNGQLSKTVILDIEEVSVSFGKEDYPHALALTIVVLLLLIASMILMVFLIIKTFDKKMAERNSDTVLGDSKVHSEGIVDNRLSKIYRESKYIKLIENVSESVSEHEEETNASRAHVAFEELDHCVHERKVLDH